MGAYNVNESNKALDGIKIIDFTHFVAGPYCTKLLAGFGATVIKIEKLEGDAQRNELHGSNISFLWLNTGKESITLDLKTRWGREKAKSLIADADLVVENFSPGVMYRLGLGFEELKKINPDLIMVSISNFGQTGPYRDYNAEEIQLGAISGLMDNTGDADREPLTSGPKLNQYTAGLHAYLAAMLALQQRGKGEAGQGEAGQLIDISIMESSMELIENRLHGFLAEGTLAKRGPHLFAPWGNYACKDGYATVIGAPFRHWATGVSVFESPELGQEKYFQLHNRIEDRKSIDEIIKTWASKKEKKEIFKSGQENGLSFGYVETLSEVNHSVQHHSRQFFETISHPLSGPQPYCGAPFKMSATPWKSFKAPLLGEQNKKFGISSRHQDHEVEVLI